MAHNLAAMHRDSCQRFGRNTALRFKRFGRYQDLDWLDYRHQADGAAAGLVELGVKPGDRVALFSENRYEWLVADYAILSAGAANVPLHAPLTAPQAAYQIDHSDARGIIVSNQAQADKIAAVINELPKLEFLISFEPVTPPPGLKYFTWEGLKHRGWQQGAAGLDEILRREQALTGTDLATIIYTSGTTGRPKGVILTHENLLSNAVATCQVSDVRPGDVQLSWLPYSHIYARTVDHYLTSVNGTTLALADSVDTLLVNLEEIQPMWMTAVPRFYEKVWTAVEGLAPEERPKRLRKIFGPRLRHLSSGGAPLPRHIGAAFVECGIPIYEGYGLTESSPVISFNSAAANRLGTVGHSIPDVEVKIAPDGEVLTRGPHVMRGYWKNPEATAETIVDGWLHTGDVGTLDADGFLAITDRKKDLIITSGGKNIAPTELERLLISDPYIDQAVVYGDRRPFVSAIVVPNFPLLTAHADGNGWKPESSGDFITSANVLEFYQHRIDKLMAVVSQPERVKKILVLARPFQLADDELTATLKVRRRHIIGRFETQLSALYESDNASATCGP
ncbi:MAG TPA: AMP-dependent synthetase/ligase [Planctomycetaceae bacterium]|nr:AMP-dependent synthetase/ligase [Planctomycetaceae bacterium]